MLKRGEDLFEALQYRNYKPPLKRVLEGFPREDVAHAYQSLLEQELAALVRPFAEREKAPNLCLCGGIFANVKASAALFRQLGFENVYVFPHMGDGGLGPGAALELLQASPQPFDDVYWGPDFGEEELERALSAAADQGLRYRREDDVEEAIAERLADHRVIARFNGRMEFGPRALGNRSILYGADEPEANTWLNKRLGRTEFMPFAPIVMAEHAPKLFEGIAGTEHTCKFMTIILDCTDWMKERCPAVVHVDGTARPQFGCWGIVEALNQGADIVITGRTTDAAMMHGVDSRFRNLPCSVANHRALSMLRVQLVPMRRDLTSSRHVPRHTSTMSGRDSYFRRASSPSNAQMPALANSRRTRSMNGRARAGLSPSL